MKITYNGQVYEVPYNSQTGYYEIDLTAPIQGGIQKVDIEYTDLIGQVSTDSLKIQVFAKEKIAESIEETIVYFLDRKTLDIKDLIEFENYNYVIDEETNKTTVFDTARKPDVTNGDIVLLKRDNNIDYMGIIQNILNEDGEVKHQIPVKYISNIFDRKIILKNENIILEQGVEDFIAKTIYDEFTNSDDKLLNVKWLDVEVLTHTKIKKSVDNENGIYNFHTFITNCTQNYNVILDFAYVNQRIKLSIYKQEIVKQIIDATIEDVSNYSEQFEANVTAKVVVKTDTDVQIWYLKSNRTTTQDINDTDRAEGNIEVLYTPQSEDAYQVAMDAFKSNSYEHMITFRINRNSELFDVSKLKVGTPVSVKTKNNIILDTYISAVNDSGDNFIEYTSGNMRIEAVDKILKERKKQ